MSQAEQSKFNRVVFSSKSYKHNTPDEVIEELNQEFHFTFDPAVPARFGSFTGNALKEPWKGRVFCNPPYKRTLTLRWVMRAWQQVRIGNCQLVVLLLPFRNNASMKFLRRKGAELRLCDKRLHFSNAKETAPFDSFVAIISSNA